MEHDPKRSVQAMTDQPPIRLTPELRVAVERAATFRGMSADTYVSEVLSIAARLDAELAADLKEAEDDIAAGRVCTQKEVEAKFNVRREQRSAA